MGLAIANQLAMNVFVVITTNAICLTELLKVENFLQQLDIRYNSVNDDGISSIADGYNTTTH